MTLANSLRNLLFARRLKKPTKARTSEAMKRAREAVPCKRCSGKVNFDDERVVAWVADQPSAVVLKHACNGDGTHTVGSSGPRWIV
jgi:hypothetical protein